MSKTMKKVKEEVKLKKEIGQHFRKWDNTSTYELISKKEKLKKLGLDIEKKEKYTLFDVPFESEQLLYEALINITIALGYDDMDAMEEGQYFQDEIDIIDALYDIRGGTGVSGMGGHIADISKAIKLKTKYTIDIGTIKNRIFDILEKRELDTTEEQFIFDQDILDYLMDNADIFGIINPRQDTDIYGEERVVFEKPRKNGEWMGDGWWTADEKRDVYIEHLTEEAQKDLEYARESANELLKDYKPVGTSENFSEYQIKQGILNTIDTLKASISDKNILEYKPLKVTTEKMLIEGRNQYLERLPKLLKEANVNYVLQDDNGRLFFPFIADMFFTHYVTQQVLKKNEAMIKALKELEYQSEKSGVDITVKTNDEIEKALTFHKSVKINQVWNYVTTIYANKHNVDHKHMATLIKFFIYPKSKIYTHSLKEPSEKLPYPLTELDKFTKNI
ncbi:hypothetical protein ACLHDG_00150 [Sulfurovum sp. CS9]|uniref:hypothetical protein n=1 Tax=Sulfurovum sp. CS9 TaxID=3391146 RepID=UPI0039EB1840